MPGKHVRHDLSAFCHGELPAERARRVGAHLEACARCREEYDAVRFGVELAGHVGRVPAPDTLWSEVTTRLDRPAASAAPIARGGRALAHAAGVMLVAMAAFGLWYLRFREPLEMAAGSPAPSALEAVARDAHARRLAGALQFDYPTDSPEALRAWLQHQGFDVNPAINRPPEDAGRFRVRGAKVVPAGGARAALVGYEIDAHPVTLLVAPLREVRDAPPEAWFGKKVTYRFDVEHGVKLLTWGASGLAYVLVSDLPGRGTDACSICHTAPERRELIRKTRLKSGA